MLTRLAEVGSLSPNAKKVQFFLYAHNCQFATNRSFLRVVASLRENGATNHHHHHRQCHQLQTALARVLDELGLKRKHFQNSTGKISLVQVFVQLIYRIIPDELVVGENVFKTEEMVQRHYEIIRMRIIEQFSVLLKSPRGREQQSSMRP